MKCVGDEAKGDEAVLDVDGGMCLGDDENFASKSDCEEFSDEFSMLWARIDNDCDFVLERG